jgi:hypothetical protein
MNDNDHRWAVFVYRGKIFFERRSVPYLATWYSWNNNWLDSPAELGEYLQRNEHVLPELDASGSIPLLTKPEHLEALLKWARDDDLSAPKKCFTFEEARTISDYLCSQLTLTYGERPNRPYKLADLMGWQKTGGHDMDYRNSNPFAVLARLILWMTPNELRSVMEMMVMIPTLAILMCFGLLLLACHFREECRDNFGAFTIASMKQTAAVIKHAALAIQHYFAPK